MQIPDGYVIKANAYFLITREKWKKDDDENTDEESDGSKEEKDGGKSVYNSSD